METKTIHKMYFGMYLNKIFKIPVNYSAVSFLKLLRSINKNTCGYLYAYSIYYSKKDPNNYYVFRSESVHPLLFGGKTFHPMHSAIEELLDVDFYKDLFIEGNDPTELIFRTGKYCIKVNLLNSLDEIEFKYDRGNKSDPYLMVDLTYDASKITIKIKAILDCLINLIERDKLSTGRFNDLIHDISLYNDDEEPIKLNKFIGAIFSCEGKFIEEYNYDKWDEYYLRRLFIMVKSGMFLSTSKQFLMGPLNINIKSSIYININGYSDEYYNFNQVPINIRCIFSHLIDYYPHFKKYVDKKWNEFLTK